MALIDEKFSNERKRHDHQFFPGILIRIIGSDIAKDIIEGSTNRTRERANKVGIVPVI